jgi:hypothetical protein
MVRNGVAICYCSLHKAAAARLLEIPQWMFDATTCYAMHLASTPAICIEAMLDLARLLAHPRSDSHDVTIRLRHHSAESGGGASAKHTVVSDSLVEIPHWEALPYELDGGPFRSWYNDCASTTQEASLQNAPRRRAMSDKIKSQRLQCRRFCTFVNPQLTNYTPVWRARKITVRGAGALAAFGLV